MWRLTSDTLPDEPTKRLGAPVATVWGTENHVGAPVCRLMVDGDRYDLPDPELMGDFYLTELPWSKTRLLAVNNFTAARRHQAESDTYWQRGSMVGAIAGSSVEITAEVILPVPYPVDYLYQIDLSDWGTLSIESVTSEGMMFFPAADPENLTHPEWKFEDSMLSIQGEPLCHPRKGGQIEATIKIINNAPLARVHKFTFLSNIECDLIEYLGYTYTLTDSPFPQAHEFIWSDRAQAAYIFEKIV